MGLSIYSEAGHATAAYVFDVQISRVSFCLIFGFIPFAYVEIDRVKLFQAPRIHRLVIYLAGIWNNIALCGIICLLWSYSSTLFFWVHDNGGEGATVVYIPYGSPLESQPIGVGDVIGKIDNISVRDATNLVEILQLLDLLSSTPGIATLLDPMYLERTIVVSPIRWDDAHFVEIKIPGKSYDKYLVVKQAFAQVQVCDYALSRSLLQLVNRMPFSSFIVRSILRVPRYSVILAKYVFCISASTSFFNLLPLHALDGKHVISEIIQVVLSRRAQWQQVVSTAASRVTLLLLTLRLLRIFVS